MKRTLRSKRRSAWAASLLALGGCSPASLLTSVDRLTSTDGVRRVEHGAAYGADARQRLDVWAPRLPAEKALPVVVFFYGGGWNSGSRGEYGFAGAAYAGQGFIAVVPDYRLVPGVRFPAFLDDGALAVKWARDNAGRYGGDPDRIVLAGHSAGAYIGAMLALDQRYLKRAGVDPGIVKAAALSSGPFDFHPFTDARSREAFGAWPNPRETQPINVARAGAPPMFLAHGSVDRVVGPYNSRNLARRLRGLGVPVTLRIYPGASHVDLAASLSGPFRGRTPVLAESASFLRQHAR